MITRLQVQILPPPNFFLIFDLKTRVQTFPPPNFFIFFKNQDIQVISSIAGNPSKNSDYTGDQDVSLQIKQELVYNVNYFINLTYKFY